MKEVINLDELNEMIQYYNDVLQILLKAKETGCNFILGLNDADLDNMVKETMLMALSTAAARDLSK